MLYRNLVIKWVESKVKLISRNHGPHGLENNFKLGEIHLELAGFRVPSRTSLVVVGDFFLGYIFLASFPLSLVGTLFS